MLDQRYVFSQQLWMLDGGKILAVIVGVRRGRDRASIDQDVCASLCALEHCRLIANNIYTYVCMKLIDFVRSLQRTKLTVGQLHQRRGITIAVVVVYKYDTTDSTFDPLH